MLKVAVIWNPSRGSPNMMEVWTAVTGAFRRQQEERLLLLLGDAPGLDIELRCMAEYVVYKPYHLLDRDAEFNPKMFFVANKQKIQNADAVLVHKPGDGSTDWAIEYARKIGKIVLEV